MSIRRQLNVYISGIRDTAILPPDILKRAAQLVGQRSVEANREMILENKMKTGADMPAPSPRYRARKARIVAGPLPKGYGVRRTPFAAKTADDRGRVSGRLVSDITYQNARFVKGEHDLDLYADVVVKAGRSRRIFGYLEQKGFEDMVGPPNPNTNRGREFRRAVLRDVFALLRLNARAKGVVLEETL